MNKHIKTIPKYLIDRFKGWKATTFEENKSWYQRLAAHGQNPRAMVISCCDSRVHATAMFGADTGEFFIHRNIANLIPPFKPDGDHHGTSAAIEFAVSSLKVAHIIVLGHSSCGGISNGYRFCKNNNQLGEGFIFVNKWLNILKPAFENLPPNLDDETSIQILEKESIKVSIANLVEFPFVKDALDKNELIIHGLWHDIGTGALEMLEPKSLDFIKV